MIDQKSDVTFDKLLRLFSDFRVTGSDSLTTDWVDPKSLI